MSAPKNPESPQQDSVSGCVVRLCWMLVGNAAIFVSAVFIAQGKGASISKADAALWAIVALLIAIRYVDIKKFKGLTATAEPATMAHWRRYVGLLIAASFCIWAAAHGVAFLTK